MPDVYPHGGGSCGLSGDAMSDTVVALARLLDEEEGFAVGTDDYMGYRAHEKAVRQERNFRRASWLVARGVRVLPSEPSEAAIEAARTASGVVRGQPDNLRGRREIIAVLRAAYAVDAAPRPEEP